MPQTQLYSEHKRLSSYLQIGMELTNDQQFKTNSLMSLNTSEDEAIKNFKTIEHFNYLDNLIRDEDKFMDTL